MELTLSSGNTRHCSPRDLLKTFNRATAGTKIIYAIGNIGRDKHAATEGALLDVVATLAFRLVTSGRAYGFQRKICEERYEYFILKGKRRDVH
jgi:hypothetical protein